MAKQPRSSGGRSAAAEARGATRQAVAAPAFVASGRRSLRSERGSDGGDDVRSSSESDAGNASGASHLAEQQHAYVSPLAAAAALRRRRLSEHYQQQQQRRYDDDDDEGEGEGDDDGTDLEQQQQQQHYVGIGPLRVPDLAASQAYGGVTARDARQSGYREQQTQRTAHFAPAPPSPSIRIPHHARAPSAAASLRRGGSSGAGSGMDGYRRQRRAASSMRGLSATSPPASTSPGTPRIGSRRYRRFINDMYLHLSAAHHSGGGGGGFGRDQKGVHGSRTAFSPVSASPMSSGSSSFTAAVAASGSPEAVFADVEEYWRDVRCGGGTGEPLPLERLLAGTGEDMRRAREAFRNGAWMPMSSDDDDEADEDDEMFLAMLAANGVDIDGYDCRRRRRSRRQRQRRQAAPMSWYPRTIRQWVRVSPAAAAAAAASPPSGIDEQPRSSLSSAVAAPETQFELERDDAETACVAQEQWRTVEVENPLCRFFRMDAQLRAVCRRRACDVGHMAGKLECELRDAGMVRLADEFRPRGGDDDDEHADAEASDGSVAHGPPVSARLLSSLTVSTCASPASQPVSSSEAGEESTAAAQEAERKRVTIPASPPRQQLRLHLKDGFHRLVAHGVAAYHGLRSFSENRARGRRRVTTIQSTATTAARMDALDGRVVHRRRHDDDNDADNDDDSGLWSDADEARGTNRARYSDDMSASLTASVSSSRQLPPAVSLALLLRELDAHDGDLQGATEAAVAAVYDRARR